MRRAFFVSALFAATALAAGTIDTTGASIESGAAPTRGAVRIVHDAPAARPPAIPSPGGAGDPGPPLTPIPEFEGGGSGAEGAFSAATDATFGPGLHEYTSYTVADGVTVTYEGDVEIRTTGRVDLAGTVRARGRVMFHCGSDFVIAASDPEFAIDARGDVELHAGGQFGAASRGGVLGRKVVSSRGDVLVVAHGVLGAGDVEFDAAGDVRLLATGAVRFESGARVGGRRVLVRGDTANLTAARFGAARVSVEGAEGVTVDGSSIAATALALRGFAGGVQVDGSGLTAFGGGITIDGNGPIRVAGDSQLTTRRSRALRMTSRGSTVQVARCQIDAAHGGVFLAGAQGVRLSDAAYVSTTAGGRVSIRSSFGDVAFSAYVPIVASGDVDMRAASAVTGDDGGVGYTVQISGRAVSLSAGPGGVSVLTDQILASRGPLAVLAAGPLSLRGTWASRGPARFIATDGGIDVAGASLGTMNAGARPSGSVLVESYSDTSPSINAANGEIWSGRSGARSGDVVLRTRVALR